MASNKWSIGTYVIGKYCPISGLSNAGTHKVFIQELMPTHSLGVPVTKQVPLNKGCFCNASNCLPSVSNSVTVQNYISLNTFGNSGFQNPYFRQNDTLRIEILDENIDNMYITNTIDPSHLYLG